MNHPLLTSIASLDAALDEVAGVDPIYLTTKEKEHALTGWSRIIGRAQAQQLRVLAAADDIAEQTGDRSTAHWLATATRDNTGTVRRHAALADALDQRWTGVAEAFAAGDLNLAQVRVITEALAALPADLGQDLVAKAERLIVSEAATLGPRELRVFGTRLLEYLAPDIADDAERQRLLAEERRASAATRLTLRRRGDGSTDLTARVPDHVAGRLNGYLDAYTAPRRHHLQHGDTVETPYGPLAPATPDVFGQLPLTRQRGEAFVALLENIPTSSLPRHGGTATSVMVTLDYQTLLGETGTATTSTGESITAGQARRLACQAGIIPVVLGGPSEVLDVGRTRRLVTDAIRKALNLRDRGCTAIGCSMPAAFCEAHHVVPWSSGGRTSLENSKLLCSFHHHRAHDPGWDTPATPPTAARRSTDARESGHAAMHTQAVTRPVRREPRPGDLRWDGEVWLRWNGRRWTRALYALRPDRLRNPASFADEDAVTPERRARALALAVDDQVAIQAAVVVHEGPTGIVLGYRRKPNTGGHALLTALTFGAWTPLWVMAATRRREDRIRLEADRWGNVWGTPVAGE